MSLLADISFAKEAPPDACATGRYIIRAQVPPGEVQSEEVSLLRELLREDPARLIHLTTHTVSLSSLSLMTDAVDKPVLTVASELTANQLSDLKNDSSVLSIEPDCLIHIESVPNDPVSAANLWPRDTLNLRNAWTLKTDSSNVIVAVSDTGIDLTHEDLAKNIWTNTVEKNGQPGIDDDGNGCIDDLHGCDFGEGDGDPTPFNSSEGDHGTHVAGIIGAVGDNAKGVTGVTWSAQLMAVKGFDSGGNAYVSDLLKTLYYSVNNGARVINCSWGAERAPLQSEKDAFQFAIQNGVLPVVAAGNSSVDAAQTSPAGIDGVMTVGSLNSQDQVSAFSNFGTHVSVYAPGGEAVSAGGLNDEFIYSTLPAAHGSYGNMRGTSMAAPFVTGIAALIFSTNPKFSPADVKQIIVSTARHVLSKIPNGSSADILIPDAEAALRFAATYTPTAFSSPSGANKGASASSPAAPLPSTPSSIDSSSGCALRRDTKQNFSWVVLLFPIALAIGLKKRDVLAE